MEDWYINALLFLQSRANTNDTASLVSAGASGWIIFWCVHHLGGVKAVFNSAHFVGKDVTSLATDPNNKLLIVGDASGYLKVWRIMGFCTRHRESVLPDFADFHKFPFLRLAPSLKKGILNLTRHGLPPFEVTGDLIKAPLLLTSLRAHMKSITDLVYVPEADVIISSSSDCSVRMHSVGGQFIGIFGVPDSWKNNTFCNEEAYGGSVQPQPSSCLAEVNMPPDVRRIASATTLKVLFNGMSPLYNVVKKIMMYRGPVQSENQASSSRNQPQDLERSASDENVAGSSGQNQQRQEILGHHFRIPRKHQPLPAINQPHMQAKKVSKPQGEGSV